MMGVSVQWGQVTRLICRKAVRFPAPGDTCASRVVPRVPRGLLAVREASADFRPREVIRLMANLVYTGERDVYTLGIVRNICDSTCGTGGVLSESEKFILGQNESANLLLHGQEYNDDTWAICCGLITAAVTGQIPELK